MLIALTSFSLILIFLTEQVNFGLYFTKLFPLFSFPPIFPTVTMSHIADPNESLSSFSISHIAKYMSRKTLVIDTASTKADSVCRR